MKISAADGRVPIGRTRPLRLRERDLAWLIAYAERLEARRMSAMTRYERDDLQRLIRQQEKVLKSAAKERSGELLADFENQMGQEYQLRSGRGLGGGQKDRRARSRQSKRTNKSPLPRNRYPGQFAPSLVIGMGPGVKI